ncbi:MAG: glycosyltransferase family 4 protein [Acidobacteriota bacterium]|nr:glycosyltransferase family 4 protein [Acidobacteriota bacterium]
MKILLAHKNCNIGGVETFMSALAGVLQNSGHECELFFFERGPAAEHLPPGCAIHFGDLADCLNLVSSQRFDIVHTTNTDWVKGISAVRNVGAKLVVSSHGMIIPGWTRANCDALVTCSVWLAEEYKAVTDIVPQVVLNGIDTCAFKPADEAKPTSPPIIAWVGRGVDDVKEIGKFAAVAPTLYASGLRVQLAEPYGAEKVEAALPGATGELPRVADFWGAVPREKMPDFYREVAASGGCVISTSSREGLPLALIEAQACGCPVIGADVRGVNECVAPEHGGVLYPFDIEAGRLASLVLDTLRDEGRMRWRREASARYARERFNLTRMAEDYLRVYEGVKNSKRQSLARIYRWFPLASLLSWRDYVESRWVPGHSQYETSRRLAERGEWALAGASARASLATCPTLYLRPRRMAYLLKTQLPFRTAAGRADDFEKQNLKD